MTLRRAYARARVASSALAGAVATVVAFGGLPALGARDAEWTLVFGLLASAAILARTSRGSSIALALLGATAALYALLPNATLGTLTALVDESAGAWAERAALLVAFASGMVAVHRARGATREPSGWPVAGAEPTSRRFGAGRPLVTLSSPRPTRMLAI
ncbi:MAG: hypothetical protein ACYDCK_09575 [Thermoplasmatota archaeon]